MRRHIFSSVDRKYLDLLQKVMSNTLFFDEPDREVEVGVEFMSKFSRHYIKSNAISLLPKARFDNIEELILSIDENQIEGDLIETGVWRGGSVIYMRALLEILNIKNKKIWVADSFEGLPVPDENKNPLEAKTNFAIKRLYDNFEAGIEEVKNNFERFDLLDDQVMWLKGWFKDTLPSAPISKLSLIRLDGDYYDSTMDGLVNLYDKLSIGGYVIVDDYAEDAWTNCRRAIDEFRISRGINSPLTPVDKVCVYWQKVDS